MKHHSRKLAETIKTRVGEMPPRIVAMVARCALSQCTPGIAGVILDRADEHEFLEIGERLEKARATIDRLAPDLRKIVARDPNPLTWTAAQVRIVRSHKTAVRQLTSMHARMETLMARDPIKSMVAAKDTTP